MHGNWDSCENRNFTDTGRFYQGAQEIDRIAFVYISHATSNYEERKTIAREVRV